MSARDASKEVLDVDYIIVGAGSAGCVVARRLIDQTDATILLLEAGGTDTNIASVANPSRWVENLGAAHDWNYVYAPSPQTNNRQIPLSRGKIMGGSGSTNALVWARGNKADYDGWAAAGNRGWDYASVLPLFRKSEDWEDGATSTRGAGGPLRVERAKNLHPVASALIEAGISCGMPYMDDVNIANPAGTGPINMNVMDGERCSTARAFLHPIAANPRLTIVSKAQAVRLLFSGDQCHGLEYLHDGAVRVARANSEVILCAGAIDTPRLLLLSGIGPQKDLRQLDIPVVVDSPNVGQNLQDHPIVASLCFQASEPLAPFNNNLEGSTLFAKSRPDLPIADLMFVSVQAPFVTQEVAREYGIPDNSFCIAPGLMRVRSRGYLRMLSARFDGPLEIQPNLLAEAADVEALLAGIELGFQLASQPAFQKLIEKWAVPPHRLGREEKIAFLRQSCGTYFHPVGTCAMGAGSDAVVDEQLLVRGVHGLRIADASVMPEITSANTHAPTVMIAEFASNLIARSQGISAGVVQTPGSAAPIQQIFG